jgi:hypothetical protein
MKKKFPMLKLLSYASFLFSLLFFFFSSFHPRTLLFGSFCTVLGTASSVLIFLSTVTALQIQRLIINETEDLAVTRTKQSSQGRRETAV